MRPILADVTRPGWSGVTPPGRTDRHTGRDQPDRQQGFVAEGRA